MRDDLKRVLTVEAFATPEGGMLVYATSGEHGEQWLMDVYDVKVVTPAKGEFRIQRTKAANKQYGPVNETKP